MEAALGSLAFPVLAGLADTSMTAGRLAGHWRVTRASVRRAHVGPGDSPLQGAGACFMVGEQCAKEVRGQRLGRKAETRVRAGPWLTCSVGMGRPFSGGAAAVQGQALRVPGILGARQNSGLQVRTPEGNLSPPGCLLGGWHKSPCTYNTQVLHNTSLGPGFRIKPAPAIEPGQVT